MKSVETERRWMREERRWLNEASHSKPQRDVLSVKFNTIPRRTVPHTRIKRKLRNLGFDNLEQALQSQIWAFSRQKVTFLTLKRPRSTRAQILCSPDIDLNQSINLSFTIHHLPPCLLASQLTFFLLFRNILLPSLPNLVGEIGERVFVPHLSACSASHPTTCISISTESVGMPLLLSGYEPR